MDHQERDGEKARYWQRVMGVVRSGMSIREFCQKRRLRESQFYWWRRELKARREEQTRRPPGGHEDSILGPGPAGDLAQGAGGGDVPVSLCGDRGKEIAARELGS
jgi:hypothetical protein